MTLYAYDDAHDLFDVYLCRIYIIYDGLQNRNAAALLRYRPGPLTRSPSINILGRRRTTFPLRAHTTHIFLARNGRRWFNSRPYIHLALTVEKVSPFVLFPLWTGRLPFLPVWPI